jgi:hypothetical protein
MIAKMDERLKDRDMGVELLPAAKTLPSERGYDPVLDVRPLRRTIQREIEDNLSEKILFDELKAGQVVRLSTRPSSPPPDPGRPARARRRAARGPAHSGSSRPVKPWLALRSLA